MPGSYSTDLRERVLVAVEAGEPADVVAERFLVGRSSVYRWRLLLGSGVVARDGVAPKPGL
jgi:transposase